MGCAASAPLVDGEHHHQKTKQHNQQGHEDDGDAVVAEVGRGGGKNVDRAVAESSRKALRTILNGRHRDWLLDASGKRVKIDALKGAPVGILFTAQTIPTARRFQRLLQEVCTELRDASRPFEVVMVSNDETEELWKSAVADTAWLTLPFKDNATVDSIGTRFEIGELPTLILLDREGQFVSKEGIEIITKLGASAWPFTKESVSAAEAANAGHEKQSLGASSHGAYLAQVAPES